jgi:aryl-alcohol dehydrogenase-like predicted oxidoreductase
MQRRLKYGPIRYAGDRGAARHADGNLIGAITSVTFGANRLEQLTDTLAAANYKLDSAVKAALDDVSTEYRRGDAGK